MNSINIYLRINFIDNYVNYGQSFWKFLEDLKLLMYLRSQYIKLFIKYYVVEDVTLHLTDITVLVTPRKHFFKKIVILVILKQMN